MPPSEVTFSLDLYNAMFNPNAAVPALILEMPHSHVRNRTRSPAHHYSGHQLDSPRGRNPVHRPISYPNRGNYLFSKICKELLNWKKSQTLVPGFQQWRNRATLQRKLTHGSLPSFTNTANSFMKFWRVMMKPNETIPLLYNAQRLGLFPALSEFTHILPQCLLYPKPSSGNI